MRPYTKMMIKPFFRIRGLLLIATVVATVLSFQTTGSHGFTVSSAAKSCRTTITTITTATTLPLFLSSPRRPYRPRRPWRRRFSSLHRFLPLDALAQEDDSAAEHAVPPTALQQQQEQSPRIEQQDLQNQPSQQKQGQQQQRHQRQYQPDSIKALERDVQKVLKELQNFKYDPEVPDWFRLRQLSFSNYWGLEEWAIHSSRHRFQRYIVSFPKSRLLRRLAPQLSVLGIWTMIAVLIAQFRPGVFRTVQVPLTSLSLVSTFVAALQTLRSDKGLSRLSEGRLAMARMVLYTRDTAMLMHHYVAQQDAQLGFKAARHLALFGWLLKSHLRDTADDASAETLIRTLLCSDNGSNDDNIDDAMYILGERKKPVAILNRLRQIMANMSRRQLISTTEHRLIEDNIRELDDVITVGERIRSTPIPPIYAGHSTRLMMLYLLFLPLALLGNACMNGISTLAITMVVGYSMLGLDEMSHMFEQPFRFMPLHQLARVSTLDVADAFCRPPPPLFANEARVVQQQQQSSNPSSASSSQTSASISKVNGNIKTPSSNFDDNDDDSGDSDSTRSSGSYRSSYWTNVEERVFPRLPYDGRNVKKHDIFAAAPSPKP